MGRFISSYTMSICSTVCVHTQTGLVPSQNDVQEIWKRSPSAIRGLLNPPTFFRKLSKGECGCASWDMVGSSVC